MEARFAALEALVAAQAAEIAALKAAAAAPRAARAPAEAAAAIAITEVNYTLIPVGGTLKFEVKTKAAVFGVHEATFHTSKRVVPIGQGGPTLPLGKDCFPSINAWATACLKKHQEAMGRKNTTINVFDKGTTIYFKRGGEWVHLASIKTITRVGEGAATMPPAAVGGGGSAVAPVAEDAPSSQSSLVEECPRCGADVEVGEPCACEPKKCQACDSIVPDTEFLGECGTCDKDLGKCCGAYENGALTCHACHTAPEDDAALEDMDVKGKVMLFNPETGDVFIKMATGGPGDKVSTYTEGRHEWVWKRTMIAGAFHLVNHFDYVKQSATAGGAWEGMFNRATKTIIPTPAPEDA